MTALTRAIVSHDHEGIDSALRQDPSIALVPENGWLPLQWAEKGGNLVTLMRVVRLLEAPNIDHRAALKRYIERHTGNYFGGGSIDSTVEQIWEQVMEDRPPRPFSREETEIHLERGYKLDLAYFMRKAGIQSLEQLRQLAHAA
jgi:hypothetical protein